MNTNLQSEPDNVDTDGEQCHTSLPHCHCKCPYCGERDKCECALFEQQLVGNSLY